MIHETGRGIQFLVHVAAHGNVPFLHATANGKQRQPALKCAGNHRQIKQVTTTILDFGRRQVVLAVERRVNIGSGTGQVNTVNHGQVLVNVICTKTGGGQQRHTTGEFDQRSDVFAGHDLVVMPFAFLRTHRHQNNGFAR
ncbi:hypothetical protein GALL_521780 [mine drainage metagenome]|uniref:Uncharacterized protein n=1 Tax=mine drainage metagenome TaxID=410659 RepID=A0A1J5PEM1_9ZZZZ